MSLWNMLLQFLDGESALLTANIVVWNNQIDAKGFPGTLLRDPFEGLVEFLGFQASRTKNAEATCSGHRKNNCRTMAEGKNRNVHTVDVADCIMHPIPPGESPPAINKRTTSMAFLSGGIAGGRDPLHLFVP